MSRTVAAFVCASLSLSASFARADEVRLCVPASMLSSSMPPETTSLLTRQLDDELRSARKLRNGGIATAVVGAVFTLIGVPLLLHAALCENCDSRGYFTGAGIALSAIGPIAFAAGIPIAAIGQSRVKRATGGRLALAASGAMLSF